MMNHGLVSSRPVQACRLGFGLLTRKLRLVHRPKRKRFWAMLVGAGLLLVCLLLLNSYTHAKHCQAFDASSSDVKSTIALQRRDAETETKTERHDSRQSNWSIVAVPLKRCALSNHSILDILPEDDLLSPSVDGSVYWQERHQIGLETRGSFRKSCWSYRPGNDSKHTRYSSELLQPIVDADDVTFPRIIHRMWKNETVPHRWMNGVTSCLLVNADHQYCHWTDEDLDEFVRVEYPAFLAQYRRYPHGVQRADAARYLLLYHYGGVYLDLDLVCRLPFTLLLTDGCYGNISSRYDVILADAEPMGVVGDFLIARPRQDFLHHVMSGLCWYDRDYILPYINVMMSTGPWYLSLRLAQYKESTSAKESLRGMGVSRIKVIGPGLYSQELFEHLPGGSWHGWDGRAIWWLFHMWRKYSSSVVVWRTAEFVVFALCLYAVGVVMRRRYVRALLHAKPHHWHDV